MWNTLWVGTVSEAGSVFDGFQERRLALTRSFRNRSKLNGLRSRIVAANTLLLRSARVRLSEVDRAAALLKGQAYAPAALWLDAVTVVVASLFAGAIASRGAAHFSLIVGNGMLVALLLCGILRIGALNAPFQQSSMGERIRTAAGAWCAAFATAMLLMTLMVPYAPSSDEALWFFALGGIAATLSRAGAPVVMRASLHRHALSGRNHIVICPAGDGDAECVTSELERAVGRPVRKISYDNRVIAAEWPYVLDKLAARVRSVSCANGPGDIFVVAGRTAPAMVSDIVDHLATIPRSIFVAPDSSALQYLRLHSAPIGSLPIVEVRRVPHDLAQLRVKRLVDLSLSLIGLMFLLPLFLIIAAAIKLETRGPVFFRQARTGYRGRRFRIFKFRTMRVLEDGPNVAQAKKDDPRVTRIGSVLRRSSLDELPQLINVLMGDMSLVGPRPHAIAHDEFYDQRIPDYALRQHVRPGITGWAQIHGLRGETSTVDAMRHRVEHDLWYATNGRLLLDFWIMVRTCVEIFRCRNAY